MRNAIQNTGLTPSPSPRREVGKYYPFGSSMVGYSTAEYHYSYGMNTQEKDDEIYGEGNSYSAEYWQYDPRLARRWNNDPVLKAHESLYATFANNPIWFVDFDGADTTLYVNTKSLEEEFMKTNKDQYTGKRMKEEFQFFKKRLIEDLTQIYKDNNLNIVIKETDKTYNEIEKDLDITDQHVDFLDNSINGFRGYNYGKEGKEIQVNLGMFKKAIRNNSTLWLSNTIVHESGHGFIKQVMNLYKWDETCLKIDHKHHVNNSINIMQRGGLRSIPQDGHSSDYPKTYKELQKAKDNHTKSKFKFIEIHQSYFKTYLNQFKYSSKTR